MSRKVDFFRKISCLVTTPIAPPASRRTATEWGRRVERKSFGSATIATGDVLIGIVVNIVLTGEPRAFVRIDKVPRDGLIAGNTGLKISDQVRVKIVEIREKERDGAVRIYLELVEKLG